MKIVEPSVELLWITPEPEWVIEKAARTCYKSQDKMTDASYSSFCKTLVERGHLSQIEHAVASFKFICDRATANELVRHRLASYSQTSTRYVNYEEGIEVIKPPKMVGISEAYWKDNCIHAEEAYINMINQGCKPEIARSVLPLCLATEIILTANFRELLHIVKLRTSKFAHPQIKEIIIKMNNILNKYAPDIFVKLEE